VLGVRGRRPGPLQGPAGGRARPGAAAPELDRPGLVGAGRLHRPGPPGDEHAPPAPAGDRLLSPAGPDPLVASGPGHPGGAAAPGRSGLLSPAGAGAALVRREPSPLALAALPPLAGVGAAQRLAGAGRPVLRGGRRPGAGLEPPGGARPARRREAGRPALAA